jgi:hypothetical protein
MPLGTRTVTTTSLTSNEMLMISGRASSGAAKPVETGTTPGMPKSNPETNANAGIPRHNDLK